MALLDDRLLLAQREDDDVVAVADVLEEVHPLPGVLPDRGADLLRRHVPELAPDALLISLVDAFGRALLTWSTADLGNQPEVIGPSPTFRLPISGSRRYPERFGSSVIPTAAQQAVSLARPPGGRVVTLPRSAADKPQETAAAVNPRDPPASRGLSFHQAVGARTDHPFGMPVEAIARTAATIAAALAWPPTWASLPMFRFTRPSIRSKAPRSCAGHRPCGARRLWNAAVRRSAGVSSDQVDCWERESAVVDSEHCSTH